MNHDEIVKALRNCGGGPEGMKITRAAADCWLHYFETRKEVKTDGE